MECALTVPFMGDFAAGALLFLMIGGIWAAAISLLAAPWALSCRASSRPISGELKAGAVAFVLCGAVAAGPAFLIIKGVAPSVSAAFRPWVSALIGVLIGLSVLGALPWLIPQVARLKRFSPPSVVGRALFLLLSLAAVVVGWALDPRLMALPAAVLAGFVCWVGWLPSRFIPKWPVPVLLVTAGVAIVMVKDMPAARTLPAASHGLLLGWSFDTLAVASDGDGDGYGDLFGGGDCDDKNPAVHPAALDVPGNQIDENCRGGDAGAPLRRAALPAPAFEGPKRPHVVLLVLDAVRADQLFVPGAKTPNLDRLAEGGVVFERALTPSTATRLAIPALLSGRSTGHTAYRETHTRFTLDVESPWLPAALKDAGYRTFAVVPPYIQQRFKNLGRGFDRLYRAVDFQQEKALRWRTTPQSITKLLPHLRGRRPVFAYLHLMDAHSPYTADGETPLERYRGEIARLDADLKPLVDHILALRGTRGVIVAVTADHGETFDAHGESLFHGENLNPQALRIPLMISGTSLPPSRVQTPVDLLDLGVTLGRFAGVTLDGAEGDDLRGLMEGSEGPNRLLFSEVRVKRRPYPVFAGVVEWPHQLVTDWKAGVSRLSRLDGQPIEDREGTTARLKAKLIHWSEVGHGPAGRLDRR